MEELAEELRRALERERAVQKELTSVKRVLPRPPSSSSSSSSSSPPPSSPPPPPPPSSSSSVFLQRNRYDVGWGGGSVARRTSRGSGGYNLPSPPSPSSSAAASFSSTSSQLPPRVHVSRRGSVTIGSRRE